MALLRSVRHDTPDAWHQLVQAQERFVNRYGVHFTSGAESDSRMEVADSTVGALQLTHDWSLAFWYKPGVKWQGQILTRLWAGTRGMLLVRDDLPSASPTALPYHLALTLDWTSGRYALYWAAPPVGEWAHIALVNEGHATSDPSKVKLYINGVLQTPYHTVATAGAVGTIDYTGHPLTLGGTTGIQAAYTRLDEMLLYSDRALTVDEVLALRDLDTGDVPPAAPPVPSPNHHWRFGDAPGDLTAQDLIDLDNSVIVRPTVFHDVVGAAHFELASGSAGNRHQVEVFSGNTEYRSGAATVILTDDDLPYAVREMVANGTAALEVTGVEVWLLYASTGGSVPTTEPTLVQWGPEGGRVAMDVAPTAPGAAPNGHAYVVPCTFPGDPPGNPSTLAPVTVTFHQVPDGLQDVALVVQWKLSFT